MTVNDAIQLARNWAATARYIRRHRRVSEFRMRQLEDDLKQLDQEALYCWVADRIAPALEGFAHVVEDRLHKDPTETSGPQAAVLPSPRRR